MGSNPQNNDKHENIKSEKTTDINEITQKSAKKHNIFKFFYNNNNIFKMIKQEDFDVIDSSQNNLRQMTLTWTGGAMLSSFLFDKVIFKYFKSYANNASKITLPSTIKYVCFPFTVGILSFAFYRKQLHDSFYEVSKNYEFSEEDYSQAMQYLENAKKAGKLDELLEKGVKIDWKSIRGVQPSSM